MPNQSGQLGRCRLFFFINSGLHVGAISDATFDLTTNFKMVTHKNVNVLTKPQRDAKTSKKCAIDLCNFESSESEKEQLEILLTKYSGVFAKNKLDVSFNDKVRHEP